MLLGWARNGKRKMIHILLEGEEDEGKKIWNKCRDAWELAISLYLYSYFYLVFILILIYRVSC